MVKVNIKCIFPFNYYLLRKVSMYVNNAKVGSVGNTEETELLVPENSTITFRIDIYKHTLKVPAGKDRLNILLYFKFRAYFPFSYLDFYRRNALQSRELTDSEFERAFETTYNASSREIAAVDTASSVMALGLSALCLYASIFQIGKESWQSELSFLVGLFSIISVITLHVDKKSLLQRAYKVRIISTAVSLLITGLVINLSYTHNIIFLFIALLIILRVSTHKKMRDKASTQNERQNHSFQQVV